MMQNRLFKARSFQALRIARAPVLLSCALTLAACASAPTGPDVMVLPGTGKSLAQFQRDDAECRAHAQGKADATLAAAETAQFRSTALGVLAGTALGAVIGGNSNGAATGAAIGLGLGAVAGPAGEAPWSAQTRYDNAYVQCMYTLGHRVPVSASMISSVPAAGSAVSRPLPNVPPPPPGSPPPPPPAGSVRR